MQGRDSIDMFTGVSGSIVRTGMNNINAARSGDMGPIEALAQTVFPIAGKNLMSSLPYGKYDRKGLLTSRGTQVMTPEEITPYQRAMKSLGFQPSQWTREYEKRNAERLGAHGHKAAQNRYVKKIGNEILERNEALKSNDKKRADKHQENIDELYKDLYEFARKNGIQTSSSWRKGLNTSINNFVKNRINPDVPTRKSPNVDYNILDLLYEEGED